MKRVLKIILLGMSLGLVMLLAQNILGLDNKTFFNYYLIIAAIGIILTSIYGAIKMKKTLDVLKKFQMSIERGETNEIIFREIEEVEAKNTDMKILNYIYINKSVYYSRIGDYSNALNEINKVEVSKLNDHNKMIYFGNIIGYTLKLGDRDGAMSIYEANKNYIDSNINKFDGLTIKETLNELKQSK